MAKSSTSHSASEKGYEVWMEVAACPAFPDGVRIVRFKLSEEEEMFDLLRGCRFSDTNYYVFKNGKLTNL